jgi:UDP:flavonoid glycosyltransferase YjiC (YdhE family)
MARIGVICFPGVGHLNPFTALGHALQERGHEVVFFGIADVESRVRAAGLEFSLIGSQDYPPGTLRKLDERLSELNGLAVFRFTVERVKNTAMMVLRDAPEAIRKADVDVMIVDQADMGGGSVADYLDIPFASVSILPPFIRDNRVPPFFFGWPARYDLIGRIRNELGIRLLSAIASPLYRVVNRQRQAWGLKRFERREDALSHVVQITQLPRALEFEGCPQPALLHYSGPFRFDKKRPPVSFPWELLDGRPLVYASLGTLQNGSEEAFRIIASGCVNLDVQLVISLGGGGDRFRNLPGRPIVVEFAPQLELLKRASVVITHAGLNTVLESIAEGKPMVAIPIGNDQPGVAARVAAKRAGIVLSRRTLTPTKVENAVRAVLKDDRYRQAACAIRDSIGHIDGAALAAAIIEEKLALQPYAVARQARSKDLIGSN